MMLLLIFLGMFVDQVSMMLITLPVFMPIVQRLDIDLIWFGVLYLICMQLGLLLPPHGLLLMTMKGVAPPQVTMAHIFRAVVPYVVMSLVLLVLLIVVSGGGDLAAGAARLTRLPHGWGSVRIGQKAGREHDHEAMERLRDWRSPPASPAAASPRRRIGRRGR